MTQLGGVPLADRPIKVGPVNDKADHSGKNAAAAGGPPGPATGNWRLDDSSAQGAYACMNPNPRHVYMHSFSPDDHPSQ